MPTEDATERVPTDDEVIGEDAQDGADDSDDDDDEEDEED